LSEHYVIERSDYICALRVFAVYYDPFGQLRNGGLILIVAIILI